MKMVWHIITLKFKSSQFTKKMDIFGAEKTVTGNYVNNSVSIILWKKRRKRVSHRSLIGGKLQRKIWYLYRNTYYRKIGMGKIEYLWPALYITLSFEQWGVYFLNYFSKLNTVLFFDKTYWIWTQIIKKMWIFI